MNNRVLVAGLIGGIVIFVLGYLIYGVLLAATMSENIVTGVERPMEEFQWAFLILGNLALGFLLAYILDKANALSFSSGASVGAVVGLLYAAAVDFTLYGVWNVFASMTGPIIDIIATTVMCAIVGGVIGWWYGRGRKAVVA